MTPKEVRSRIVEMSRGKDGARPADIVDRLGLSRNTVHRYLRELVQNGLLEARGSGPAARYFAAGLPELEAAHRWYAAGGPPKGDKRVFETRELLDLFLTVQMLDGAGDLERGEMRELFAAIALVAGNCFDHNAGAWRDAPGCWLETQRAPKRLWIWVADRGQGVLRSLRRAHPEIGDEQEALVAAFEKRISGSGRKGEGLKKVRELVSKGARGIACRSGRGLSEGLVDYGKLGPACRAELARLPASSFGTFTLIAWGL